MHACIFGGPIFQRGGPRYGYLYTLRDGHITFFVEAKNPWRLVRGLGSLPEPPSEALERSAFLELLIGTPTP